MEKKYQSGLWFQRLHNSKGPQPSIFLIFNFLCWLGHTILEQLYLILQTKMKVLNVNWKKMELASQHSLRSLQINFSTGKKETKIYVFVGQLKFFFVEKNI